MSLSREQADLRKGRGAWIAGGTLLLWVLFLFYPATTGSGLSLPGVVGAGAVLWYLLNTYVWFVPEWRATIIERRGPLLGVGFAFGAALVGVVADSFSVGLWSAMGVGAARLVAYALPFILPLALRLPYRPHPVDLSVIALAAILPRVSAFTLPWAPLSQATAVGGLLSSGLGGGSLGSAALLTTYFYAARYWTLAPLDLKPREGDGSTMLMGWVVGVGVGVVGGLALYGTPSGSVHSPSAGTWAWLEWSLAGLGLAALVEVLLFRSLLQAWIARTLAQRLGWSAKYTGMAAALVSAAFHAWYGPFGLVRGIGFLVSLAHGLIFARSNRYFPAVIAYGLILLTLVVLASAW